MVVQITCLIDMPNIHLDFLDPASAIGSYSYPRDISLHNFENAGAVLSWQANIPVFDAESGYTTNIPHAVMQFFGPDGRVLGKEFAVKTSGIQSFDVSVIGDVAIVSVSVQDPDDAQRSFDEVIFFGADGQRLEGGFRAVSGSFSVINTGAAAMLSWRELGADETENDTHVLRRLDGSGNAIGADERFTDSGVYLATFGKLTFVFENGTGANGAAEQSCRIFDQSGQAVTNGSGAAPSYGIQSGIQVVTQGDGATVLWRENANQDGDRLVARTFDGAGVQVGSDVVLDLQVGRYSLASISDDRFVVTWQGDKYGATFYGQVFSTSGSALGEPFQKGWGALIALENGGFLEPSTYVATLYDSTGVTIDTLEFQDGPSYWSSVTPLGDGGLVVIIGHRYGNVSGAQVFDASGQWVGEPKGVSAYEVEVHAFGNGSAFIAWRDEAGWSLQFLDASGTDRGPVLKYSSFSFVKLGDGGVIMRWQDVDNPNAHFAQVYDADGSAIGEKYETGWYQGVEVVSLKNGNAVLAWREFDEETSQTQYYYQMIGADGQPAGARLSSKSERKIVEMNEGTVGLFTQYGDSKNYALLSSDNVFSGSSVINSQPKGDVWDQTSEATEDFTLHLRDFFSDEDFDPLSFEILSPLPTGFTFDPTAATLTKLGDGVGGVFGFEVLVTDGRGGRKADTFQWQVNGGVSENEAPKFLRGNTEYLVTYKGEEYSFDFSLDFSDPEGQTLSYSTTDDLPTGLTLDAETGVISGVVDSDAGTLDVRILATDSYGAIGAGRYSFLVEEPQANRAPIETLGDGQISFGFLQGQVVDDLLRYEMGNWFADPDGDDLTFVASGLPEGLIIDYNTGELSGTVTAAPGTYAVTLYADDGKLHGVEAISFEVHVGPQPAIDTLDLEYAARIVAYSRNGEGAAYPGLQMTYKIGEAITSANGFVAVPITSEYGDAILAVRGTASLKDVIADLQPGSIGKDQVDQAWGEISQWLADNPNASITGHSLGGAQAQYIAVLAAQQGLSVSQVATFNAPGIGQEYIDAYEALPSGSTANNVSHYIAKGDLVSMAGDAYLPGDVHLYSFFHAGPNPIAQLTAAHTSQWAQQELVGTDGYDWSLDFFKSVKTYDGALSSAKYSHLYAGEGASLGFSPEYFNLMLMVARIDVVRILSGTLNKKGFITDSSVELIKHALSDDYGDPTKPVPAGPLLSMKMMTRGNIEEMREAIGFKAFEFLQYVELTQSALDLLASSAATVKVWAADMFDRVADWTEDTWSGVANLTADAWTAAIDWGVEAWDVISTWTAETWGKVSTFSAEAWKATASWTVETWNKVATLTDDVVETLKLLSPHKVWVYLKKVLTEGQTEFDQESSGADDLLYSKGSTLPTVGAGGDDALLGGAQDDFLFGDDFELAYSEDASAQVYRLYQATLDRAPDVAGHKAWTIRIATNELEPIEVVTGFVNSQEFKNTYGGLDNTQFVKLLYSNVLDRAADEGGLLRWSGELNDGTMSREQVVLGFSDSPEFKNKTNAESTQLTRESNPAEWSDDVYRLYQATLNRTPDESGLLSWANALGDGQDFATVIDGFVNSREFQNTYGELSNTEFVTLLYNNVLDRSPDEQGLVAWLSQLERGASRAEVVRGFSQSVEFTSKTKSDLVAWMRSLGENDLLSGGGGHNVMAGGMLADTFEFKSGIGASYEVVDLERWDFLDVSDFGFSSAVEARNLFTQSGSDLLFEHDGSKVVLKDYQLENLHEDMFVF